MKITDWIKWWNIVLVVPCLLGLCWSCIFTVVVYVGLIESGEVDHDVIAAGCLMLIIALVVPFLGTMYTAYRFISLKKTTDFSSKFAKIIKTRQYFFTHIDLIFILSLILYEFDKNGQKFLETASYSGVFIIF